MDNLKTIQLDFGFESKPISNSKINTKSNQKLISDSVFDMMDCLTSPIIVFKSAWQDTVPKDILDNISMSRMISLMSKENTASITEVVAYMMPRTLEGPMSSEWTRIYTWCGLQYAKLFKKKSMVEAMKDIAPSKLSQYEMGLLNNLRRWIYNKRREALKVSLKNNKKETPKEKKVKQKNLFHHKD